MSILRYMLRRINASTSSLNKHRFGRENSRGASLLQKVAQQWENSRLDQAGCIRCRYIISALIGAIVLIIILLSFKVSKCILTILLVIGIIALIITIIICFLMRNRQRRRTSQPVTSSGQNYQSGLTSQPEMSSSQNYQSGLTLQPGMSSGQNSKSRSSSASNLSPVNECSIKVCFQLISPEYNDNYTSKFECFIYNLEYNSPIDGSFKYEEAREYNKKEILDEIIEEAIIKVFKKSKNPISIHEVDVDNDLVTIEFENEIYEVEISFEF